MIVVKLKVTIAKEFVKFNERCDTTFRRYEVLLRNRADSRF
jgi:hypothetical protein